MTYKQYQKALAEINKRHAQEVARNDSLIADIEKRLKRREIDEKQAQEERFKVYDIINTQKTRFDRWTVRLKTNFANQDTNIKVGDIIWADTKRGARVLRVTDIKLATFDYPMLKVFGVQLTLYGIPCKIQQKHPKGGIYQKDITSINGEPYEYKVK